jgi:hypothetical protein
MTMARHGRERISGIKPCPTNIAPAGASRRGNVGGVGALMCDYHVA